jgi:hypothetical protein
MRAATAKLQHHGGWGDQQHHRLTGFFPMSTSNKKRYWQFKLFALFIFQFVECLS